MSPDSTPRWRQSQRDRLADPVNLTLSKRFTQCLELRAVIYSFSYDVSGISVEIISHIFSQCLPADGRVFPSPHAAPLLLAQICGRWSQIALEMTALWRSFDFTLRAGSLPLTRTAYRRIPASPGEPMCDGVATLLET
ncbi:hypothetical protein B0H16DRAFT_1740163 [Mycena metata]|uniref:F-box domain-containing protein n=1 Tax=Mycena metata TaxID=1033252 RepID=A0AAD7HDJ8_9AGAR|nr:hypothetical protein B0H16DRAFT_1740163 [Mycena metata]